MTMQTKRAIMDSEQMDRTLNRIATEIIERVPDQKNLILVGIQTRGVPLARRLLKQMTEAELGLLDITLYRDDLTIIAANPVVHKTDIPGSLDGKHVVLVDDVLFTGRTVRAAMDNILDYGRPDAIRLAVLIDRGHRELPIQADFVGKAIATTKEELVEVRVAEVDGDDAVWVMDRGDHEA